jgi:hypothetical protein
VQRGKGGGGQELLEGMLALLPVSSLD